MAEDSLSRSDNKRRSSGCLRALVMLMLGLMIAGGVLVWKFQDWARAAFVWFGELPTRLVSQTLTESFRESVTAISSTNGDVLEVAVMRKDETVTKYDMKSFFNDLVYLGTTVSEIRTPVVYRYHIKLSDPWDLRVDNGRCIVHAPAMRPSLPPAIETQGMEKKSEAGWLRFNAAENLAELEKGLTPSLERRAGNKHQLDLVREPSRKSVAEFVRKWLLKQDSATTARIVSIVVLFPDEIPESGEPPSTAPTLLLEAP
ncbi:MAG: hypothetical protein U0984_16215 [Prosthecobacter sp.]|nr:hypothetical protein [Prosthecobacter sp.]